MNTLSLNMPTHEQAAQGQWAPPQECRAHDFESGKHLARLVAWIALAGIGSSAAVLFLISGVVG